MQAFAAALPDIRKHTAADLARPGLPREKVLATVVQLLEKSLIRVGNDEYAKANRSFGLTTLRNKHVDVRGSTLKFEFRGKSGVLHSASDVNDRRLARIVKQCRDLPGQELFQYIDDDGTHQDVTSQDVNAYLKEITGEDFTAKDFRTWSGTVLAATALREFAEADSVAQAKKNVLQAIEAVAGMLGQHPRGLPQVLHPPRDHRLVHGRLDVRRHATPGQHPEDGVEASPRRSRGPHHPAAAAQESGLAVHSGFRPAENLSRPIEEPPLLHSPRRAHGGRPSHSLASLRDHRLRASVTLTSRT